MGTQGVERLAQWSRRGWSRDWHRSTLSFGGIVLFWQMLVWAGIWSESLLPSPASVAGQVWEILTRPELGLQILDTVRRVVLAAVIGLVLGVAAGSLVSLRQTISDTFGDFAQFMQSIGEVGWLPMLILWLGFGDSAIVAAIAYTVFFPVYFATIQGFRTIPGNLEQSLRTLGANRWQLTRDLVLPGSLPSIIAGFRTGFGFGWRTVILAEMLVITTGLGAILFRAREFFFVERVLAGMVIIGVLWIIIDALVLQRIEKMTVSRWGVVA